MAINNRKILRKSFVGVDGFSLVELLVVVAILGILAIVALALFNSAQITSRDDKRKNDLTKIAAVLERYYSDYGVYPPASDAGGLIKGCICSGVVTTCVWGAVGCRSAFTDNVTVYMRIVPADPSDGFSYYYRPVTVNSKPNQGYQLYARLENTKDRSCILGSCGSLPSLPADVSCGTGVKCNYAVTSKGVAATQD
jgi:prepilin-type N-terminal cleavage/methylation domain-containing protein